MPAPPRAPGPPPAARSYAVVGVGAVGGYYGARLAAAGHPVCWVARSDAAVLAEEGLLVESPTGTVRLERLRVVTAAIPADEVPAVDVVLLATKTTATASALPAVVRMVEASRRAGRSPTVVCLQNGYAVEQAVAFAVGADVPVLGGLCFICAEKVGPGHVRHLDYGAVTVAGAAGDGAVGAASATAASEGAASEGAASAAAIAADLVAAGVPATLDPDLLAARWRKLVWNVPFNGLSAVLDAGTNELLGDQATRSLVTELMAEVVGAAAATGHPLEEGVAERMVALTEAMRPYDTSMRLDRRAGRPLEVEAIYWAPIRAAAAAGWAMPRTAALAAEVAFLDRRSSGRTRA